MEVLGGRGAVGDADIVAGGELEEPFQAGAGVLWTLAFQSVRQQQNQARRLPPLRPRRDDELVDDHLARVHEVTELRLPENQDARRLHAVTVLEAQRGGFGEGAVVDGK